MQKYIFIIKKQVKKLVHKNSGIMGFLSLQKTMYGSSEIQNAVTTVSQNRYDQIIISHRCSDSNPKERLIS